MATAHLEVESKYDVDGRFALPDLASLPGVAAVQRQGVRQLTATYFDTEDVRLARAAATLRRRTGGTDPGWHLKLPAGSDRLELRESARTPPPAVPASLVPLVRSRTRGEPLAPVLRLRTRRYVQLLLDADGRVLAEVADDRVIAEPLPEGGPSSWREIEVELVDGDRDLLAAAGRALRSAGAKRARTASKLARALADRLPAAPAGKPSSRTAGEVAVAHIAGQLAELQGRDPQVRLGIEDSVHRMRVASRRLRSALATFRPLFDRETGDRLREELKWLGGVLGPARDAEVMHERLRTAVEGLAAELVVGPVKGRIDEELNAVYKDAFDQVIAELDGERYRRLLDALNDFVADPPYTERAHAGARRELRRRVAHSLGRVERAFAEVDAADSADQRDLRLHEVRKSAKRARYAGESVTDVFAARARAFAGRMEHIQETLGAHQDSIVARHTLFELAERADQEGESCFTYGVLHGLQAAADGDTDASCVVVRRELKQAAGHWPT